MSAERKLFAFPTEVFDSPVLRDLDDASREAVIASSRVRDVEPGVTLYDDGDVSESFFVVLSGAIELQAVRRGESEASALRVARAGETFGEEATLPGLARRASATATAMSSVVEVPISVFRRAMGRSGGSRETEREKRYLHRSVTRDIVHASALGRGLEEQYLDVLLDAAELRRIARGAHIYDTGDSAEAFYLIADGLVQLQFEKKSQVSVLAYLSRGDFFGNEEIESGRARDADAIACGDTWCIRIPAQTFRQVAKDNPQALSRLRRVVNERTRPAAGEQLFSDIYRMKAARSLLVIDQDSCVRCGHCAWSCSETHGESRLVRRGDTFVVSLGKEGVVPTTLSLPNTCQHCRNAACMVDCPTGAIGRDVGGEVFIREALCTGCGSCVAACPWENISLAPREETLSLSPTVAVKCDLCRGYESPACVQACPTEAIFRIEPERDIAELRHLLGTEAASVPFSRPSAEGLSLGAVGIALSAAASLAFAGLGFAMQRAGTWYPSSAVGIACASLAAICMAMLAGYAVPKRMVRLWMRKANPLAERALVVPRSRLRPLLAMHVAIGLVGCAAAMAHAGVRLPSSPAGALNLAFWTAIVTGCVGGLLYVVVPRRLTRLERSSALPEDLKGRKQALLDQLYRQSSGREELVKAVTGKVLVPYARAPFGSLRLLASGRSIKEEQRRLRGRIDTMLQSRGADRLDGLDQLIETVVDLRAAPSRWALTAGLRGWLPLHILTAAMACALLLVHIALVLVF